MNEKRLGHKFTLNQDEIIIDYIMHKDNGASFHANSYYLMMDFGILDG